MSDIKFEMVIRNELRDKLHVHFFDNIDLPVA